jgi:hypothetical protein
MIARISHLLRIFVKNRLVTLLYWVRARPRLFSMALRVLDKAPGLKRRLARVVLTSPERLYVGEPPGQNGDKRLVFGSASTEIDQVYGRLMRHLSAERKH